MVGYKGPILNTVAGTLFGLAWWLMIDAAAYATHADLEQKLEFVFMLPGIFTTFALMMIVTVDWSILQGFSMDQRAEGMVKCWLLAALMIMLCCVFGAIFILADTYANTDNVYGGVAIVLQNFLIIISAGLFRAGRNQDALSI